MTNNFTFYDNTINELWREAVRETLSTGSLVFPRNIPCREIVGSRLVLTDPTCRALLFKHRRWSLAYAAGELVWYLAGRSDLESIKRHAPSYGKFSDDGTRLYGAYGPRIFGKRCGDCGTILKHCTCGDGGVSGPDLESQWDSVAKLLKKDPHTRQAVIAIHSGADPGVQTKDYPCTLSLQFLLRGGHLALITTMRSNDLWLGLPYDVFCFSALQELMAMQLHAKLGPYIHQPGSLHVYQSNEEAASMAAEEESNAWTGRLPLWSDKEITADEFKRSIIVAEDITRHEPIEDAIEALKKLAADPVADVLLSVLTLGPAAWRWKRIQGDPTVREDVRQTLSALLSRALGPVFDYCFN